MDNQAEVTDLRVDVGVLKKQVELLTNLCSKIDTVIDKLVSINNNNLSEIYQNMDRRKTEAAEGIKELHGRVDSVLDRLQSSERCIMIKIEELRKELTNLISKNIGAEQKKVNSLEKWRYMIYGGGAVLLFLLYRSDFDIMHLLFSHKP